MRWASLEGSSIAARCVPEEFCVYSDQLDQAREPPDGVERSAIEASLRAVPEPFRTTLVLVDVEGFSYEEAAVSQQCSVGTIKSRVHRGRTAFRGHWERLTTPRHGSPDDHATQRSAGPRTRHRPETALGATHRAVPSGRSGMSGMSGMSGSPGTLGTPGVTRSNTAENTP